MDVIDVGRSELPGRTHGVMQTMERGAGLQVLAFMAEVRRQTGYRLTVNEGRRSRADQTKVYNAYMLYLSGRGPWAPRAAVPFSSIHDEVLHGNAVDFGGPGGAVVPANVHAVMVALQGRFGVVWTGARFNEWWHFEVDRSSASEQVTAAPSAEPAAAVPESTDTKEEDVNTIILSDSKGNIWVVDIGQHTKWNIIRGLKSVNEAMTRLKDYKNLGVKIVGFNGNGLNRLPGRVSAGLDDITNVNHAKAA